MCVYNIGPTEVAKRNFYVYKIVQKVGEKYHSNYHPASRMKQTRNYGIIKTYSIGKPTKSNFKNSQGLYCYKDKLKIQEQSTSHCIIKCLVLKGTKWKRAYQYKLRCILAECVIPIEVIE